MLEFSKRLKQLREFNNLTLKQLSEYLDVGISAVSGYELYNKEPPYEKLCQLAKLFDVSTDYLLGLSNELSNKTLHICLKIAELIKSKKLTEGECAKEIGINKKIIIEILKDKKLPSDDILKLISDYFDIPTFELTGQIKNPAPKDENSILEFVIDKISLPYIKLAMRLKENDNEEKGLLHWVEGIIDFKMK